MSYLYYIHQRRIPDSIGNKAAGLHWLWGKKYRVPLTMVFTWQAYLDYLQQGDDILLKLRRELEAFIQPQHKYAIRSSTNFEDGLEHSFAGQFKTILDAFATGGQVEEVFIQEGELVKKGAVIARLAGKEQLQSAIAAAEYELLTGPDPDEVAVTEARLQAAEARLAAARADLTKLDLLATMDGKVVELNLVVDIQIGQLVTITPDALPEVKLGGEIVAIRDNYAEKRGEITYTVRIKLNDTHPLLRWGMTVIVDLE